MKKKKLKHKISKEVTVELVHENNYPEYICVTAGDYSLVLWTSDEALKLAYKLMSLASEMK